jgi:hypothetical protein
MLSNLHPDESLKTEELLAANLVNPDPLLGELAAWILYKTNRDYYFDTLIRFEKKTNPLLSDIIRKIKARDKNTDLLIYEKILLIKNTEFFVPVHELDILNLVMGINETSDSQDMTTQRVDEPLADAMVITSEKGYTIRIPTEKLFELMTGDPVMTERYLRLFLKNNNV